MVKKEYTKKEFVEELLTEYEKAWELKQIILEAEENSMTVGDLLIQKGGYEPVNGKYFF